MDTRQDNRDQIIDRLEQVCALMQAIGTAPYSLRGEFLDKWMELREERAQLRKTLDAADDSGDMTLG
jgi:hypothetical protein